MKLTTLLPALLIATCASDAVACSDALYRVGTGISYREYAAPLPGNVLIYGATESARDLAAALARSGHKVSVAVDPLTLDAELEKGDIDVVIASYHDIQALDDDRYTAIAYLPVVQSLDEQAIAEQSYEFVLVADRDEIKHYLKAIHRVLRNRSVQG